MQQWDQEKVRCKITPAPHLPRNVPLAMQKAVSERNKYYVDPTSKYFPCPLAAVYDLSTIFSGAGRILSRMMRPKHPTPG
jgi:hypothetical protein